MGWKIIGRGTHGMLGSYSTVKIYVENEDTGEQKTVVVWDDDNIPEQVGEKIAEGDFYED